MAYSSRYRVPCISTLSIGRGVSCKEGRHSSIIEEPERGLRPPHRRLGEAKTFHVRARSGRQKPTLAALSETTAIKLTCHGSFLRHFYTTHHLELLTYTPLSQSQPLTSTNTLRTTLSQAMSRAAKVDPNVNRYARPLHQNQSPSHY